MLALGRAPLVLRSAQRACDDFGRRDGAHLPPCRAPRGWGWLRRVGERLGISVIWAGGERRLKPAP